MSNRKPPSSAPTAPGRTRPSTPPDQSNGVAKPAAADDSQTQQIPRVTDEKPTPQAPTKPTAPPKPPAAPSKPAAGASKPATPPAAKATPPAPPTAKPETKTDQKKVQRPADPASNAQAARKPESRSGVTTAGSIAADAETTTTPAVPAESGSKRKAGKSSTPKVKKTPAPSTPSRKARLRLVRFDPWSVMKTAFALSIALAIVTVVAVTLVWAVLDVAGVWDAINSSVATILSDNSDAFDVTDYVGFGRIIGFTILIAAIDVVLITAIATIGAFLYNLAASLLGGLEITLAEDN